MRIGSAAGILLVCVVAAISCVAQSRRVAPTPTPTPADEIQRIRTEEVKLNMLAFDENGAFVPDVSNNDIVITENNILHPPSSVRRIPANVVVVMDTGGELRQVKSLEQTRKVARAVVSALRKGDSVALVEYSDRADVVQEWTNDKQQALAAMLLQFGADVEALEPATLRDEVIRRLRASMDA